MRHFAFPKGCHHCLCHHSCLCVPPPLQSIRCCLYTTSCQFRVQKVIKYTCLRLMSMNVFPGNCLYFILWDLENYLPISVVHLTIGILRFDTNTHTYALSTDINPLPRILKTLIWMWSGRGDYRPYLTNTQQWVPVWGTNFWKPSGSPCHHLW